MEIGTWRYDAKVYRNLIKNLSQHPVSDYYITIWTLSSKCKIKIFQWAVISKEACSVTVLGSWNLWHLTRTDKYKGRVRLPGVFCARPRGIELVFHVKFHFVKIWKSLLAELKALPDDRNLCSIRCCCWPLPPAVEADWPMQMLGQPRGDGSWPLFIVNDYTLLRACWNVVHFYIIIVLSGTYSEPTWMKIIIFLEVWNEKSKEIGIWGCWFKLFISMFVWGGKLDFNYYFREQFGHFLKEKFVCN